MCSAILAVAVSTRSAILRVGTGRTLPRVWIPGLCRWQSQRWSSSGKNVVICGGGNGAHTYAGVATSLDVNIKVLTLFGNEAGMWNKSVKNNEFVLRVHRGVYLPPTVVKHKPFLVTNNPDEAFSGVSMVVLTTPAYAHAQYLKELKPYVKPGLVIVGMPGRPGFEFEVWGILGDIAEQCAVISTASLPWVCRIEEYGKSCVISGTKFHLLASVYTPDPPFAEDPVAAFQRTLGPFPMLKVQGNLLGLSILAPNANIHVPIMYGQWSKWDGTPLNAPPLFYLGVSESTVNMMKAVSREAKEIKFAIESMYPSIELTNVMSIHTWFLWCYRDDVQDKSSVYGLLRTNPAYKGLNHPMKKKGDKYEPDFNFRYLTEDVPCGLAVLRGIAEVAQVKTPTIDKILLWSQRILGKEYLNGDNMAGKDIDETRCPQKYGFTTIEKMVNRSKKRDQHETLPHCRS